MNSSSSQWEILQSLNYLHSTLLDRQWCVFASLVLQCPDPAIQIQKGSEEEKCLFFQPSGDTSPAHEAAGLLCHRGTDCCAFCFCRAAFQTVSPQHGRMPGVTPPQKGDWSFSFAEFQHAPVIPLLQPFELLLNGSTAIWFMKNSQFHIISKFAEGALWPITLVINWVVRPPGVHYTWLSPSNAWLKWSSCAQLVPDGSENTHTHTPDSQLVNMKLFDPHTVSK